MIHLILERQEGVYQIIGSQIEIQQWWQERLIGEQSTSRTIEEQGRGIWHVHTIY